MVASAADPIDDAGEVAGTSAVERGGLGPVDRVFAAGSLLPELAVGNPLRCSSVTLRASVHADLGGFSPALRYVVDWDYWIRSARISAVAWLARPTVAVRWHDASETHRFKTGTIDLDEQAELLDHLYARDAAAWRDARTLRRAADRRLARAFLNRAYEALHGGDPRLARRCLKRSVTLSPRILATIASDPRLAAQMAALTIAPGSTGRLLARRARPVGASQGRLVSSEASPDRPEIPRP
jgi:hypothetical protein